MPRSASLFEVVRPAMGRLSDARVHRGVVVHVRSRAAQGSQVRSATSRVTRNIEGQYERRW